MILIIKIVYFFSSFFEFVLDFEVKNREKKNENEQRNVRQTNPRKHSNSWKVLFFLASEPYWSHPQTEEKPRETPF